MKTLNSLMSGSIVASLATGLLACGSKPVAKKPALADNQSETYTLTYTDVMEFIRGVESSFVVSGSFTDKSPAQITIDGLPDGALFENGTLTWTPSCDLKPENGQFLTGYMIQRLRINLTSTVTDNIVQKPAIVIIHKDGENSPCT